MLRRLLKALATKPTAGWALRRGQLVHGVTSPIDYLMALREYSLKDHAAKITCPVLVCNAEGDDISASAPQLVEALTCEKELHPFHRGRRRGRPLRSGSQGSLPRAIVRVARQLAAAGAAATSSAARSASARQAKKRR